MDPVFQALLVVTGILGAIIWGALGLGFLLLGAIWLIQGPLSSIGKSIDDSIGQWLKETRK